MDTINYYITLELDSSCNWQKTKFDIIKSEIGRIIPVHSMLGKLMKIMRFSKESVPPGNFVKDWNQYT